MIVVDTSALVAIFLIEPEASTFLRILQQTPRVHLSAANLLETAIVTDNRDEPEQLLDLDDFLIGAGVEIVPVTPTHARLARDAYRRFGKGNRPAGLNFGECFAYALAKQRDLPRAGPR